jgi:GEVED domain/Ig-like domain CHU_C associated/MAM domain, meprin/A5/mu
MKKTTLFILILFLGVFGLAKAQPYCTSTWTNTSDDWISNVTIGSINNTSASTFYTDYTATQSTNISPGTTTPISVTISIANGTWLQHAAVWVDWNQNFIFDASEFTYLGDNQSTAPSFTISGNITAPPTALPGPTRMRVIEQYFTILTASDGCASGTYGETEDYTILVSSLGPNDAGVVSVDSPQAVCPGTHDVVVTIQNYGTNLVDSVQINWSVGAVLQTPVWHLSPLDTIGTPTNIAQVNIGPFTFPGSTSLDIVAWTSMPNGVPDTVNINDTASFNIPSLVVAPTNLSSSSVMSSSANTHWVESGTSSQWEVQYGLQGFSLGSGTVISTSTMPQAITGLASNTPYDFYVRSICPSGDSSGWTGPETFLTTCVMSVAPFYENFDGNAWISGTNFTSTDDSIDQCWTRNNLGYSFRARNNNIGLSSATGPSADFSGTGNYMYTEASSGSTGDSAFFETPWIDLSAASAPVLTFQTHFYGTSIGTVHAQISNGGGWTTVWTQVGQVQLSSTDPWIEQTVSVTAFSFDTVKVRFVAISLGCCSGDLAIDEVRLRQPPPIDLGMVSIDSPNTNCGLSASEPISITFYSGGFDTIMAGTNINMNYRINGGSIITEAYTHPTDILNGDTISYTFTSVANLSTPGNYDFQAFASVAGDGDGTNDTLNKLVISIPVISSFPYFENFESGQGGWRSGGISDSWAYGTPAKNTINSASSGTKAWVTGGLGTNGYNTGEASYIVGPCYDMSSIVQPIIKLDIWWSSDFSWDGAQLQASTDGGATWSIVGNWGDPDNWYTDFTINGLVNAGYPGEGWTGSGTTGSGGWLTAKNNLTGLGGNSAVLLRVFFGSQFGNFNDGVGIDNITVLETPNRDIGLTSIDSIITGCALTSSETIAVSYSNFGIDTLFAGDTIPFGYTINGGGAMVEDLILTFSLFPGDTTNYVFSTPANMVAFSAYDIKAWSGIIGDQDPSNDTLFKTITNVPVVSSFPYMEGFETSAGGWTIDGANSTWAWGTPAKSIINTAGSGTKSWMTGGLTGQYNNYEASYVTGPCFDFTNVVRPEFDFKINWETEFCCDGGNLQASTDGGTTWFNIGQLGDPNNWYNASIPFTVPNPLWADVWQGSSGGWVNASSIVPSLGGESDVFLRMAFWSDLSVTDEGIAFDDFGITEDALALDLQMDSLAPVNSNCGLSATTQVRIYLTNYGQNTVTNIPVTYYIGGIAMATEIITDTLIGGQVKFYQFNQTANLSNPQGYIITASVDFVGDMDSTNNLSPPMAVVSYQVPTVVAYQGDEVCLSGSANLFANTDIGVTRWYDAPSGGTILLTADNFPISNLTTTTTYYAEPFSPSIIPCVGIRQPVLADVSQIPQISFTGQQTTSLTIQFTSVLSPNTDSVWWDFGDLTGSDSLNPVHVYSVAGTKGVVLQGFDGSCDTSVSSAIFVLGLENGLASMIEIFPNPNTGSFQFRADDLGESITIQLLDQKGVLVLEENWFSDNGKYDRTVELPIEISAGIYHLRIVSGDRIGRIKIVKE